MSEADHDVIIVGGGPAGLSAALILGRCRRRVLVIDEGRPRNASSRALHGFLSRDGICPAEFLELSRKQLGKYECVEFRAGRVEGVTRGDRRFTVECGDGGRVSGRMVLLATGLIDELPEIEGIGDFYGVSVHPCPLCDAWEHRDEPLAVFGGDEGAAGLAEELLLWSRDLVLCTNGRHSLGEERVKELEASGIVVETRVIGRLEGEDGRLRRVVFADGEGLERSGAFLFPAQRQASDFAARLGCRIKEVEAVVDCTAQGHTSIPGVFAIGNSSPGVQLVIAAAAEGMEAALAINDALLEADLERGRRG